MTRSTAPTKIVPPSAPADQSSNAPGQTPIRSKQSGAAPKGSRGGVRSSRAKGDPVDLQDESMKRQSRQSAGDKNGTTDHNESTKQATNQEGGTILQFPRPGVPDSSATDTPEAAPQVGKGRIHETEFGNAERLLAAYGEDIKYCKPFGWCVWTGSRWMPNSELAVRKLAQDVIRNLYRDLEKAAAQVRSLPFAVAGTYDDQVTSLAKWAKKSSTDRMVSAMVSLIRPAVEVDAAVFDAEPMLFNCANGTIDLRTGVLGPHRREDYLMQQSLIAYNPNAEAPTFERFLSEIMLADDEGRPDHAARKELVSYLQRVFGYTLSGDVNEQEWYLLVGTGENGKSALLEAAIGTVLGDYADSLEPEAVTVTGRPRDANAPSPAIAAMKGKRLVRVSETEEGARLAAALIKKLSGGDMLTGRFLHRDLIHFMPTLKLFIYTNHVP